MKKSIQSACLLACCSCAAFGQNEISISGQIAEATTGEPIIGAVVAVKKQNAATFADAYGHFNLAIERAETIILSARMVGFEPLDTTVSATENRQIDLFLRPKTLETVVIRADAGELRHNVASIPVERLKAIPTLFGQPDLIKALTFLPGVSAGLEGTTGLFVRGGTPDQNLILLDGATVYNASHLFGFQSVFDPSAIKDIQLYKSGFPARFGGRLSSILDITMKEGNNRERKGEATIGLINSSLLLEGPIRRERSSYMASGRAAYLGLLLLPTYFSSKKKDGSAFNTMLIYDFNLKMNGQIGRRGKIFGSGYFGSDNYLTSFREGKQFYKTALAWGNRTASLRYVQPLGERVFSVSLLNYNHFRLSEAFERTAVDTMIDLKSKFSRSSEIEDFALKQRFAINFSKKWQASAGFEAARHRLAPSNAAFKTEGFSLDSIFKNSISFRAFSGAAFVENEWRLSSWLMAEGGLRFSVFDGEKTWSFLEPRASVTARLPRVSINASYARTAQFIHLLANNSLGLVSDLWVPSTRKIAPQSAHQISGGLVFRPTKRGWEGSFEAYFKKMNDQIDYRQGVNFFDPQNHDWQNVIETGGEGRAYGLEWMAKKTAEKWNGWLAYSLAWSERRYEKSNFGEWFPHKYDRRHNLNLTADRALKNPKWRLGMNFVLQSGARFTMPTAVFADYDFENANIDKPERDLLGGGSYAINRRNNQKLPVYHRLDASLTKKYLSKRRKLPATLSLSVYNLYGRRNPFLISGGGSYVYQPGQDPRTVVLPIGYTSTALFSVVPAISYSIKW